MSEINENGFNRDRFPAQRQKVAEKWAGYFPSTRTDEQSKNGRVISLQAELNDQADAKIQYMLGSFDPRTAIGNQLSNLAPLMNKRRRPAVRSSVSLLLTANHNGAVVPAGSIVAQSSGPARFSTLNTVTIQPNGTRSVNAVSTVFGPVLAAANTVDTIITPEFGWVSVTNTSAANVGRERDVDGVLRANMLATSARAVGTPEGIYTALINVAGVSYAKVYENKEDVINLLGMPPHSIFAVVEGGANAEVAAALFATVAYGIDYTDVTDVPGASWVSIDVQNPANLQPEKIWFSRPVDLPIEVNIVIETDPSFPDDGIQIMTPLIIDTVRSWGIGQVLYASRLYTPINTVPGVDINSILIDGTDRVTPATFEKISLSEDNLNITVV